MTRRVSPSRRTRASGPPWLLTMLIAASSVLALGGLTVIIHFDSWVSAVVLIVVTVAVVVAGVRRWTSSRWIPTLTGAIAGLLLVMWTYATREDGSRHVLPTPSALTDLVSAVRSGINHANESVIPVDVTPGFAALIAVSLVALFLVAEHLAASWGLTATAGILLLLAWLPAAILQHQVSTSVLMLAMACWVAALALTRRSAGQERPRSLVQGALATVAVILVAVIAAPLAVGAPGWGAIPRFQTPGGLGGATRLNLDLDLRSSLTTESTTTVMVYASSGKRPDTLRLYTLTDFNGNSWERTTAAHSSIPTDSGVLWPKPVADWDSSERERLDIQVRALAERNLPLPSAPRTVDVPQSWLYVPEQDEVTSESETTKDMTYSVVTDLNYQNKDSLVAVQDQVDAGVDDAIDPGYLEIAPAIDLERVSTVASTVTERATTRYAQALALQQYLRSPLGFRYDTTVSPTGDDSVSEFLDSQKGYCVQFATAMVVMARSIGIPARLAVGFLGGTVTEDDTWVVRGSDAHAWPELYFGDQGWVRFEPTPAVQTGAPPAYADPTAGGEQPTGTVPNGLDSQRPDDITNPKPGATGGQSSIDRTVTVAWWVVAGLAVIMLAVAALLWWRRRIGPDRSLTDTERAWNLLGDRLAPRIGWPDTLTPLEARPHIDDALQALGAQLSAEAASALSRVTAEVSDARYGLASSPAEDATTTVMDDARLVSAEVERSVKGASVQRRR